MPFVFIHGVNTRASDRYQDNLATTEALLQSQVLAPLVGQAEWPATIRFIPFYWGDLGASEEVSGPAVPPIILRQAVSENQEAYPTFSVENLDLAIYLERFEEAVHPSRQRSELHVMSIIGGTNADGLLLRAANSDLKGLIAAATPAIIKEFVTEFKGGSEVLTPEAAKQLGKQEAELLAALQSVAEEGAVGLREGSLVSDAQVVDALAELIAREMQKSTVLDLPPGQDITIVQQGGSTDWPSKAISRVLGGSWSPYLRLGSEALRRLDRGRATEMATRFFGDAITYFTSRGDWRTPGDIVCRLSATLMAARQDTPNEPLIVMTHSFGAVLLIDLLTHFNTDLTVDVWFSVGSQISLFAGLGAYKSDLPAVRDLLQARVRRWINFFDLVDVLSEPVDKSKFPSVRNFDLSTEGHLLSAHSSYFVSIPFYQKLKSILEDFIHGR